MSRRVSEAAAVLGRRGGKARSAAMAMWERREAARIAANARWAAIRRQPCAVCSMPLGAGKMARDISGQLIHSACEFAGADLP